MPLPGEIDEKKSRAYHLSVSADKALQAGNVDTAVRLMGQAASLDGTYSVRAGLVHVADDRKVRPTATVRKLLLPFLREVGFQSEGNERWKPGVILSRERNGSVHSLYIGTSKFGGSIGVIAARESSGGQVEYFDFRKLNIRSGGLAYWTQTEMEAVCRKLQEILRTAIIPWFEESVAATSN